MKTSKTIMKKPILFFLIATFSLLEFSNVQKLWAQQEEEDRRGFFLFRQKRNNNNGNNSSSNTTPNRQTTAVRPTIIQEATPSPAPETHQENIENAQEALASQVSGSAPYFVPSLSSSESGQDAYDYQGVNEFLVSLGYNLNSRNADVKTASSRKLSGESDKDFQDRSRLSELILGLLHTSQCRGDNGENTEFASYARHIQELAARSSEKAVNKAIDIAVGSVLNYNNAYYPYKIMDWSLTAWLTGDLPNFNSNTFKYSKAKPEQFRSLQGKIPEELHAALRERIQKNLPKSSQDKLCHEKAVAQVQKFIDQREIAHKEQQTQTALYIDALQSQNPTTEVNPSNASAGKLFERLGGIMTPHGIPSKKAVPIQAVPIEEESNNENASENQEEN